MLAPLAHSSYRAVWIAFIISNLGSLIQGVGAAWMMASITTSAQMVALVQASAALPIMLFSLIAGAIADTFDRRKIMLSAQLFMTVVSAILAATAYYDLLSPWLLLGFTFLIGCGTALNNPAWQASVGDMVPREDVPAAVSLNSLGMNLTRSTGPGIGGVIVAFGGPASAFAANAVTYIAMIIALLRWHPDRMESALPRENIYTALLAGLRYVAMSPTLLISVARGFSFGLTAVVVLALLPVITRDALNGGPLAYGLMLGAFGLGAVGSAIFSVRIRDLLSAEQITRLSFLGFAIAVTAIGLGFSKILIILSVILAGACWVMALTLFNTIVQLSTPRWVVARTMSFYQTVTFGGMAAGSWLWGGLAEGYGINIALFIAAIALLLGAAIGLKNPMPSLLTPDLGPLNSFQVPALQLDILPRSGPIAIQVIYEIKNEDLTEFLALMVERRRIRKRDGAQAWVLMRDLQNPRKWIEAYHTPTWVDYVRLNSRRTKADADNTQRLRNLHQSGEPPEVQRMIERQVIPSADDVFHQPQIDPN